MTRGRLLAGQATRRPLLCLVDDAQWLDRESADALAFMARRLYADSVAMVFAVREPAASPGLLGGLPELVVSGLAERDAAEPALERPLAEPRPEFVIA